MASQTRAMITLRSLVVGLVCGSILCCTNMYFGLQTGWVTMGSLQSALLGFGFFKMLQSRGLGLGFDAAENVIVQTTAVATATMPLSAGFVGIVPAFGQLSVEENPPIGGFTLGAWQLLAWSAALAFFGVFFAVPLREQVIIREKLPFPSGTATAKIISILHNHPLGKEDEEDEEGSRPEILSVAEEEEPSTQGDAEASTRVSREMPHADCASPFCALAHSPGAPFSTPPAAVPGLLATMSSPLPRNETTRGSTLLRGLSLPSEAHSAFMPLLDQVHSGFPVAALEQLEEDRTQWGRTWATLMWSIGITMTLTFLTNLVPGLGRFPLFDWMGFKVASAWGWEILPSFGYVGQGMIMGKRTTLSMLAGAVVGYIVLGPYVRRKGWAPGPIQDWGTGATGWCLWISLAIMLGDSLTSLGMLGCSYAYSALAGSFRRRAMDGGYEALAHSGSPDSRSSREAREPRGCKKIPVSWWGGGLLCSSALCAAVLIPMFGMAFWEPILAVLLSFVVGVLAVRALGETDLNPVSGVGKLSQIVFGIVSPGNVVANLVAGAVAEAGASQAGDIMQDFKTAHLCGVCPRAQFIAAFIGSCASIFVTVASYALYNAAWEIPGPQFPVPTAQIWLSMARLVNGGKLLPHVGTAAVWAGAAGGALPVLAAALRHCSDSPGRSLIPCRYAQLLLDVLPSGVAFAVGMYVSPKFTLPRVFGMLAEQAWLRVNPETHTNLMLVTASGLVLGEGTASVFLALTKAA